jgi:hypothetical protein
MIVNLLSQIKSELESRGLRVFFFDTAPIQSQENVLPCVIFSGIELEGTRLFETHDREATVYIAVLANTLQELEEKTNVVLTVLHSFIPAGAYDLRVEGVTLRAKEEGEQFYAFEIVSKLKYFAQEV